MKLSAFIQANRAELVQVIQRAVNFVPRSASCNCPQSRTDHYHDDAEALTDKELREWILNDEGLYQWAKSEGVRI